eukprot:s1553_g1.t1
MPMAFCADELHVLVIGAGLGTNAGLGLEVPLQHGKLLTDGSGGVVEISPEVRSKRVLDPGFPGFMGEEFWYLWEGPEGYLGNAGFIYGVLLKDPKLRVDMLQHPVTEAHAGNVRGGLMCAVRGEHHATVAVGTCHCKADKRAVREAASQAEEAHEGPYLWKVQESPMDPNDSHASPQPPQTGYAYAAVPRIIWMLWFQGWGKAPGLCLDMLKTWHVYNPGWEIRTICREDFPKLLGDFLEEYYHLRQNLNLGDKFGLTSEERKAFGDGLIPPAAESDILRLYLLNKYGGVWVDATNLCRRPLDEWLPSAACEGFFAFFPDLQSPEHKGVPHIISSFIVSCPGHPIVSAWLERTKSHWSKSYHERPDLEYLWVNKLFRKLVGPEADGGDPKAQSIWAKVPKISCEHGKKGPMRFYSGPEALSRGDRLFELMLAPTTAELMEEVEKDRETPMWKLAFREQVEDTSAYWYVLKRTLAQAERS